MTLIINAICGAGGGKSTLCGSLFGLLKRDGYNVEYVQEFAKTLTWEKNFEALKHQPYVTGVQMYSQNILLGSVEAIITDSPILLGIMYYEEKNQTIKKLFEKFVIESFKAQDNMNFLLNRVKKYNQSGRNQTETHARDIDSMLRVVLKDYEIPYTTIDGNESGLMTAYDTVKRNLEYRRRKL